MTFVMKNPGLSIRALAIVVSGIGLLAGMQFQQAPAKGEPKQQPPAMIPEAAVNEAQTKAKSKPGTETAQRQPESAPIVASTDAGEPVYDAIPGAEGITMLTGPDLVVVPADPNKPRAEQVEWRYVPLFRLEEVKYERDKRILICRIDSRLSAQTKDRVYARLREITGAPAQTAFRLNPVRLQTLKVELAVLDKKIVLRAENSGHDMAYLPIPILYRVKDDELHDLLSTNLRDLSLRVRSTHPYAAFTRHTMQVESSMTAARKAFEKVLPKGMRLEDLEKHPLIVDRDSMLQLQQALREEFRVRVEGNPVKFAGLDKVLDKVLDRIAVSNVPLHEVTRDMTDNFVVWDSKTARLDVAPNERTTMTRELEESEENKKSYKFIWDKAQETLRKSGDAETWHNTLHDAFKLNADLSVGIKLFSGSAKMNLEKRFDQSTEGSKQASREAFDKIKNSGEKWEDSFSKSYRKFKGEDWAKSAAGKILRLERVTDLNVLSFHSALLEHVERMSKGMMERVTLLPLEPSNLQQAEQEVAALQSERKQRQIDEVKASKHAQTVLAQSKRALVIAENELRERKAAWDAATTEMAAAAAEMNAKRSVFDEKEGQHNLAINKPYSAYHGRDTGAKIRWDAHCWKELKPASEAWRSSIEAYMAVSGRHCGAAHGELAAALDAFQKKLAEHDAALAKLPPSYHRGSADDKFAWDKFTWQGDDKNPGAGLKSAAETLRKAVSAFQAATNRSHTANAKLAEAKAAMDLARRAAVEAEREADRRRGTLEDQQP